MKTQLVFCTVISLFASWAAQSEQFYHSHPKVLQEALSHCSSKAPKAISCKQLQQIAIRMNQLGEALRTNPQAFGEQILSLQSELSLFEQQQLTDKDNPLLAKKIHQTKARLQERLNMVKWLESPER